MVHADFIKSQTIFCGILINLQTIPANNQLTKEIKQEQVSRNSFKLFLIHCLIMSTKNPLMTVDTLISN